jgi:anaerobic magnesium-protoporphyrin IX monomethyl ester cyclase
VKVTFIFHSYYPIQQSHFSFAIGALSASLKQAGHETSLLLLSEQLSEQTLLSEIARHAPDLVGFSATTHTIRHAQRMATWIKRHRPDLPLICGGIHATLAPAETLAAGALDLVCVGEGDRTLVELCERLTHGIPLDQLAGIWFKEGDRLVPQAARPLIEDLDSLPFVDRAIFGFANLEDSQHHTARVMASRGCPFSCAYCCNAALRKVYPNQHQYVRYRSVDHVIKEIEQLLRTYSFIGYLNFLDDNLPARLDWLRTFSDEYHRRVGLPFKCNCHPQSMSNEVVELLRQAGCQEVHLGIESGNDYLRREVLGRKVPRAQIKDAFARCRQAGITTLAYNIIGFPFEDCHSLLDTFRLNAEARPDTSWWHFFCPYPGTRLHEICKQNGFLTNRQYDTFLEGVVISQPTLTEAQQDFAFQFSSWLVSAYRVLGMLPAPLRAGSEWLMERLLCSRWAPLGTLAATSKQLKRLRPRNRSPGGVSSSARSSADSPEANSRLSLTKLLTRFTNQTTEPPRA